MSTHRRMVGTPTGARKTSRSQKSRGPDVSLGLCASFPRLTVFIATMGFTAGLIGAATGFSVQMFSNATRKVPLSRGKPSDAAIMFLRFHIPFDLTFVSRCICCSSLASCDVLHHWSLGCQCLFAKGETVGGRY